MIVILIVLYDFRIWVVRKTRRIPLGNVASFKENMCHEQKYQFKRPLRIQFCTRRNGGMLFRMKRRPRVKWIYIAYNEIRSTVMVIVRFHLDFVYLIKLNCGKIK